MPSGARVKVRKFKTLPAASPLRPRRVTAARRAFLAVKAPGANREAAPPCAGAAPRPTNREGLIDIFYLSLHI
jgi:hypothetical protein